MTFPQIVRVRKTWVKLRYNKPRHAFGRFYIRGASWLSRFLIFCSHAMAQPILFVILILVIGVTAVSGATDAPNAIATVVSTRCLSPNAAIALAAVFNFVGLVGMTYISTAVAKTMFGMVDFSGDTNSALYALCCGYDRLPFCGASRVGISAFRARNHIR